MFIILDESNGKTIERSILDHVDGPYIFSMLLAFSRIFLIMISHHG